VAPALRPATTTTPPTADPPARRDPTTIAPTTTTTTKPTVTVPPAPLPLPQPGPTSSGPPAAGGYFSVLPPGTALPSEADCAARVHRSSWEPRPDNTTANNTSETGHLAKFTQWNAAWNASYLPRVDGNFHGTTDEIFQYEACKWGWSDDIVRAQAVTESNWHQSEVGDGGHSFGILQIKWDYHPVVSCQTCTGSSYPDSLNSTSFNVDLQLAEMRGCYDGMSTYLGNTRGDLWGCIQSWYSGSWTPGGGTYAVGSSWGGGSVQTNLTNKPWLHWAG